MWWADLGPVVGSRPAKRRPVLVIQADTYNESRLATVLVAIITSNTAIAVMPGNVFLPAATTGLTRDSVLNVTALVTLNKSELGEHVADVPDYLLNDIDLGLRGVLAL
ncbi:type II toxin-antitoxin system toxin endoribonuclease MazF6 [soil metagenome]